MRRAKGRLGTRTARIPQNNGLMITSMMDMFTIILVFLLNFLDPSEQSDDVVDLPTAKVEQAVEQAVVLTCTRDAVLVDGAEVLRLAQGAIPGATDLDTLRERLEQAASARASGAKGGDDSAANATLSVRCDKAVPFSILRELLYTAGQAGFAQLRFVVIDASG